MILSPWFSRVMAGVLFWFVIGSCGALGAPAAASHSPSPATAVKAVDYEDIRRFVVFAPHPSYPYEARRAQAVGSGVATLQVDEETGRVQEATMSESTGSPVLDYNTLLTLRQWRFQPHTVALAKVPIHYTFGGASIEKHERSMMEILEPFLGPGALRKAPTPQYPGSGDWHDRRGKGIYEISDDATGQVTSVTVKKSSGDPVFDKAVVKTLRKWQFTRGPLTLELPLRFALTPKTYRIDVAR